MPWKDFTDQESVHSIALDGFVPEGPRFNSRGPWANFNHHEEVSRLETRATCAQVLIALRQGLMTAFDPQLMSLFVNDCDEDVSLSVFLLKNHELATERINPLLNRLVFMEDMLDTTGGAYAFSDNLESLHQLLWVFEPYHEFRASGALDAQEADAFRAVIDSVGERIAAYVNGSSGQVTPDTRYEMIRRVPEFAVVRETGKNGRLGVYRDGINAFLSVRAISGDRFAYTLARSSQFVPFPIPKLLKALNAAELHEWRGMIEAMPEGSWGGSDVIAGSPRSGSVLAPEHVVEVMRKAISGI
ncbi:MAG: hypothetical protein V4682_02765 [Patescibacteria group bacterium]